ncbi:unnamed protein product [Linum trigynum]|uniref:Secreted protein n=1 Tax=Linum trigynum TaxID=586398 RepID=A0AAV2DBQ1_9ROSI
MFEHVVFSSLVPSSLSWSPLGAAACEPRGDDSDVDSSADSGSNGGQGPSLQVHNGIATDGKGLQVTGQRYSEDTTAATRFFRISGTHAARWSSRG